MRLGSAVSEFNRRYFSYARSQSEVFLIRSIQIERIFNRTGYLTLKHTYCVGTASGNQGNQGKLRDIFPVREKSGNFEILLNIRENQGSK